MAITSYRLPIGTVAGSVYQFPQNTPGVLGASTGPTAPAATTTPTAAPTTTPEAQREPTQDPYAPIYEELDRQINWLPQQEAESSAQLENLAESQRNEVTGERDAILAKFPGYREEVAQNQRGALSDLASDVRNLFQAGNNYLGVRGAGDSSAANMYSYALTQQANKNRGGILQQGQKSLNDINIKETDVKTAAQQQLSKIDTWKATELARLTEEFRTIARDLQLQKGNVKSQSLAFWWDRLREIDAKADSFKNAVTSWGQERLAQINDFKVQMGQMGNYSPQQMVAGEIAGIPQFQQQADSSFQMMFPRLRDERKQIIGRLG